jgi:aspartokinase-like uncharacterized kinase
LSDREKVRVVKVGGSLLCAAGLGQRVGLWLERQGARRNVWVVGGGKLVDVVRDWQKVARASSSISDVDAHWMSVDLMSVTAKLFAASVGGWPIVSTVESLQQHFRSGDQNVIFDCRQWLGAVDDLPCSWSVTSDSIAGRLAIELSSHELVLLKSRSAAGITVEENVAHGVLDDHFAMLDLQCAVKLVDLNSGAEELESTLLSVAAKGERR